MEEGAYTGSGRGCGEVGVKTRRGKRASGASSCSTSDLPDAQHSCASPTPENSEAAICKRVVGPREPMAALGAGRAFQRLLRADSRLRPAYSPGPPPSSPPSLSPRP